MLSFFSSLFGCKPKESVLYETICDGQALHFSVKEKSHYATIQFWMEIKIGKLRTIKLTPDDAYNQTPYSFGLVTNYPHYLYDTALKQTKFGDIQINKRRMLLFIDPAKYSKQDFETINKCLSQQYTNIETALYEKFINTTNRAHFNYPQLAGILYASINDFNIIYSNSDNSQTITIPFSGNILLEEKGGGVNGKSVLASVREKPDSIAAKYILKPELLAFTNKKTGRTVAEDFSFYTDKDNVAFWVKNKPLL